MISRLPCGIAFLLTSLLANSPVVANECGSLKMLASAKLMLQGKYRPLVPVTVNGSPKQFLVDTGGIYTTITPREATALNLNIQYDATPLFNTSGRSSEGYAKVDSFELGGMTAKDVYLRVLPSDIDADGAIGPDVMKHNDVEMDFAGKKMNYFLPDHCPGKVIYWSHNDAAQIPIVLADKRWIKVPVTLDGKSFVAIIDTGATSTTISTETAQEAFGLTPGSPGVEPAGNVNGDPNLASYYHTFSALTLDGITIKNLRMVIMPDKMTDANKPRYSFYQWGNRIYSQKRMEAPELVLGMDVLKHLHLYFAFDEHNLYVTSAEVPSIDVAEPVSAIPKTSPVPKISSAVVAALREARIAYDKKDYPATLTAIAKAKEVPDLQPIDVVTINRYLMTVHVGMKDIAAADVDAEAVADADPNLISDTDKPKVFKAALQLTLNVKHYDKAAKYARFYQTINPPASDLPLIRAALILGAKYARESAEPSK